MIKVCHFTSVHRSTDTRIFYKECTSLAKAGYDTYLVAKGESREENGVHVVGVSEPTGGRLSRMTGFAKVVFEKALSLDCDIYHFHDPELLPYGLKLKKLGKTVVFDSHEDVVENIKNKSYIPTPLKGVAYKYVNNMQKKCVSQIDCAISVTPHICEKLKQINPNTVMITNYPFSPKEKPVHNYPERFTVGFAGGVNAQWSHEHIINAIENLDVTYKIFGAGPTAYLESLEALGGYKNVMYGGMIPFSDVSSELTKTMAAMALCQYNSNTNGKKGTLGNTKLFEGMAAGLPVICTDFSLWKEIVDKYECGIYVNPSDTEGIKNAIIYLMKNPEKSRKMGENGYRAVLEEYNWEQQEKELYKLYSNIGREV